MDERVLQFRVGVVVLATVIITAILIILFGEAPTVMRAHYTLYIRLPDAPGIVADSPVRKSGITIGRVQNVKFDKDGAVLVTASIDKDRQLRTNEQCRVTGSLFGGDAALDFTPVGRLRKDAEFYKPGDEIEGQAASDPMQILARLGTNLESLPEAIDSVSRAGVQVGQLAERLDKLLAANDQDISVLLKKTSRSLDSVTLAADSMHAILGDPQAQADLRKSLEQLPQLLSEARTTMQGIEAMVKLSQENLTNMKGLTDPLAERGDRIVRTVDDSVQRLDEVMQQVLIFTNQINSREGTLGKLLHDPSLYNNLNQTIGEVEQLSRNLRPILSDVRVFTSKIARDPGRLGVRGVLRRPGGLK